MVHFLRQETLSGADISALPYADIAFYGVEDLDDRSRHSVSISRAKARRSVVVTYDPATFELSLGSQKYRVDTLEDLPRDFRARSILIDATTMEFPEILLLLDAYCTAAARPQCSFVYVEPQRYRRRNPEEAVAPGAEFALSGGSRAINAIPGYTPMLSGNNKAHLVAFLGFEGGRLLRVLNADDGHFYKQVSVVFGVPPFQPNWDLHSLMANTRLLEMANTTVRYCGANNPKAAYDLLRSAHQALPGGMTNRLAVAPFGTKPMALGVALHCLKHRNVRVVFDHPVRLHGRTEGVHRTHWYHVDL